MENSRSRLVCKLAAVGLLLAGAGPANCDDNRPTYFLWCSGPQIGVVTYRAEIRDWEGQDPALVAPYLGVLVGNPNPTDSAGRWQNGLVCMIKEFEE